MVGPDRHQQRAREQLDQALAGLQQRADKKGDPIKAQQDKVAESVAKGHGTRLEQRQRTVAVMEKEFKDVQDKQGQLAAQEAALGPPGERAERDFRKQTIMTCRTLLLENALRAFMVALLGTLPIQVSVECVLTLLLKRSGARMETAAQVIYWVNTPGLSGPYRRLLAEVAEGLGAMDLRDQGKPIRVRLRDMPP